MRRLLVLGNAGFDLLCPVPHLPRAGETLVAERVDRALGGKGLNQAIVAARACAVLGGAGVTLAAPVGGDVAASDLALLLALEGLVFEGLPQPTATDQSILMVAPDGENCILSFGAAADALGADAAAEIVSRLAAGDMVLLQGNLSRAATLGAIREAVARGAQVMLNPAPLRWDCTQMLPLCGVVVANAGEAEAVTGRIGEAAALALHAAGVACAVVTLGAGGCVVADTAGLRHHKAAPATVVDTTGAGDTVCGVLAALLLAGMDVDTALRFALRAAAVTIQRRGAFPSLPTVAELRAVLP